jgi:hypothetical protein
VALIQSAILIKPQTEGGSGMPAHCEVTGRKPDDLVIRRHVDFCEEG